MKGFIVYPTYETKDEITRVLIFGRLENQQSFVTVNTLKPYFYIKKSDEEKVSKYLEKFQVQETKSTNFNEEKVIKIIAKNQTELNKLYKAIHKSVETYEADIKPHYRFMIDNNLLGTIDVEGHYESSEKVDRIYTNPEISSTSNYKPKLKVASIDIESSSDGKLYCIGIYSEKEKQVFMITKQKLKNTIQCNDEPDCLEKFKSALMELDPDIITGWNVIEFDLVYLKQLFEKHKIPFDLGRTNSNVKLRIESNFFRSSSADIPGRQVIDGLSFIRDPFIQEAPSIKNAKFESYTLESVSQEILGKGKILKGKGRHEEIESLYKSNSEKSHQKLSDYNLLDCELVYKILEKTNIIDLATERSQLTGMPIDRLTSSIASFDSLYLRESKARNIVCPTTHFGNKEQRITGGYVYSEKSGIFNNLLILDFKSLYPSIIKTFNIDPASYLENPKIKHDAIESPNKAYFKNQSGILPDIIAKLHAAREKAKKEKRELSSYAIKIIMNSFFGVLASPNCRFFNLKVANAITHFGQHIIKLTAKEIEKKGYDVIYMDTDSVFVLSKTTKEKANKLGKEIENQINKFYKEYVKKNYNRESYLELEFEKLYLAMMLPKLRHQEGSAKKRYAGLIEKNGKEEIEITGLEAIRGDWTEAAQDFQKSLLLKAFKNLPIDRFIKNYIKDIKAGKLDKKLVYRKSIRKSLDKYTKTTPPHVKAARKLPKLESNTIEYYITTDGPEPIQALKHKLDYDHYIEKQIKPIANQVLQLLNKDFDEITQTSKQTTLF